MISDDSVTDDVVVTSPKEQFEKMLNQFEMSVYDAGVASVLWYNEMGEKADAEAALALAAAWKSCLVSILPSFFPLSVSDISDTETEGQSDSY